jgi:16S rRNA (guanine(966)-N(2))-methyltransferase RsmD
MKIYGNRQIKTLPGQLTRPTSARVREALFNIWQEKIVNCRWLDLCAGNGSMGAEALLRGAQEVIGIEQSPIACKISQQNWQKIANSGQVFQVIRADVRTGLKRIVGKQFDHIYFDPPYSSQLYEPILQAIAEFQILAPDGEIAVEHNPKFWQAKDIAPLKICREKRYGSTVLTFFSREDIEEDESTIADLVGCVN